MEEYSTTHVGLDVHKDTTAIAVAGPGPQGARFVGTVGSPVGELLGALSKLGEPASMRIVYEAGPCGYSLVRRLRSLGYACELIAPAKVARPVPGIGSRRTAATRCTWPSSRARAR